MAEGQNKWLEDLKGLSISDYCGADNYAFQVGEKKENSSKLTANYQEFTENFPAPKTSCFSGNTIDKLGCGNKELEIINRDSPKHHVQAHSTGSSAPFLLNSRKGEVRQELISEGKDIADLIVGSYRALIIFQSFYDEWSVCRMRSQTLLEQLAKTIRSSSKKTEKIKNIICGIELAEGGFEEIRNPALSLGAKIAAMISTLILKVFGPNFSKKDVEEKELEIRQLFQQDIDTSSTVYIYGVQCVSQFEETCKAIRDFFLKLQQLDVNAIIEDKVVVEFLSEISDYNPSNVSVFYKILRRAYERLIKNSKSKESRDLMKVFEIVPDAVGVINLLCWRFDSDGFDNTITQNAWDELFEIFSNSDTRNLEDFLTKIQNCIFFLEKERKILEKSVLNLLNEKS